MGQFVCVQNAVGLVFDSYIQVLDIKIFKGYALHIIVLYQWVLSLTLIYKYKVLGIFKGHALHIIVVFQWVSLYKYKVLGIFKGHALHIIVVYQWVLSLNLIYTY